MRRHAALISCLIAIVIIIAHDAIHHHHSGLADIEFSWFDHHDDQSNKDDDHNHFPVHQHLISEADVFPGRNTLPVIKTIRLFQHDDFIKDVSVTPIIDILTLSGFTIIAKEHIHLSPLIISLNKIRGSPSVF